MIQPVTTKMLPYAHSSSGQGNRTARDMLPESRPSAQPSRDAGYRKVSGGGVIRSGLITRGLFVNLMV